MYSVYVIVNLLDPQWVYVGMTKSIEDRYRKHCSKSSKCVKLRRAMKRLGKEAFQLHVLRNDLIDDCAAFEYEMEVVKRLRADGHFLYNITHGGGGAPGRHVSKQTRRKLSASLQGRTPSPQCFEAARRRRSEGKDPS